MDNKEKKLRREVAIVALIQIILIFYAQVVYDLDYRPVDITMFMSLFLLFSMIMPFVDINVKKGATKWDDRDGRNDDEQK